LPTAIGKAPTFDSDIEKSTQCIPSKHGIPPIPERKHIMSKHHEIMLNTASKRLVKATLAYAESGDRSHFEEMAKFQDLLWMIAKQIAAAKAAAAE
jgi:hypothetical protein